VLPGNRRSFGAGDAEPTSPILDGPQPGMRPLTVPCMATPPEAGRRVRYELGTEIDPEPGDPHRGLVHRLGVVHPGDAPPYARTNRRLPAVACDGSARRPIAETSRAVLTVKQRNIRERRHWCRRVSSPAVSIGWTSHFRRGCRCWPPGVGGRWGHDLAFRCWPLSFGLVDRHAYTIRCLACCTASRSARTTVAEDPK
jgi:hypothetical protein